MIMSTPVILYILECRHVQPGRIGVMEMTCMNCGEIRKVVDVHSYEWRVWCETCNYKPWCGLSQMLANHTANGHVRKHDRHKVKVLYMENPHSAKLRERLMEGALNVPTASSGNETP